MPMPSPRQLDIGAPAPQFALPSLSGEQQSLGDLLAAGRPLLLLFIDPNCRPCWALLPPIARWQREHRDSLQYGVISVGTSEESRSKFAEVGLSSVLFQHRREVAEAYHVSGTPSAVLVRPDGRMGSDIVAGVEAIEALVERLIAPPSHRVRRNAGHRQDVSLAIR
jgi:peroxiredoxin